jgi:drug/metabolite transporter (DMT)-like permease
LGTAFRSEIKYWSAAQEILGFNATSRPPCVPRKSPFLSYNEDQVSLDAATPSLHHSKPFRSNPVGIAAAEGRVPGRGLVWLAFIFLTMVWAVNFVIGKITLRYLPPMTLASMRVVLAGLFMLLLNPLCRRLPAFAESIRARQQRKSWSDLWTFLYLGFLGVTINQVCFTVGLRYTSVSHSAIIVGLGPVYALVLAVFFRLERATLRKVAGMGISLLGVILMASVKPGAHHSPTRLGDVITFVGSLGFAFYAVLGKRVAGRYDALTMNTYNFAFGAVLVLPVAIDRAIALGPLRNWLAIPWQAWAGMAYMALFSSSIAYLFYFWLLRYLEVTQLAAYNYLLPVTATAMGVLFLGERGSWIELFGGALALAGVYWIESSRYA